MNKNEFFIEEFDKIVKNIRNCKTDVYLIGIAGPPGCGKTTIGKMLEKTLENSILLPLDGYHKYLVDLDENQKKRRGSPETFNLIKFKEDILKLKINKRGLFPDFDHAKKDPEENKIEVKETHKFIIIEGLYLFLNELNIVNLFDIKIFVECSDDDMFKRLIKRHISAGIVNNEIDAFDKVKNNDKVNKEYIMNNTIIDQSFIMIKT